TAIGGLAMVGATWNAIQINVLSDSLINEGGNGIIFIALAAIPLVLGLVILSKLQKKREGD
ncbi:MAG: hypothetical protein MJA84_02025, partial [Firmicutes bacterium]|nr:hypothetical protein [Bacillota bacterium]